MSEVSKETDDVKRLASNVYEILKSRTFLRDLYWDCIQGFKDKPTFKLAREAMDKLLNKQVDDLTTLTDSKADSERKKSIVAEICSVAYAMDTVFSKIVFMHVQKEYKSSIHTLVKELREEGRIADDVWTWFQITQCSNIENSEKIKDSGTSTSVEVKGIKNSCNETSVEVKGIKNSCNEDDKKIENHKYATRRNTESEKKTSQKRMAPGSVPKQTASEIHPSTPKKRLPRENNLSTKESMASSSKRKFPRENNLSPKGSATSPPKKKLLRENDLSSKELPSSSKSEVNTDRLNIFSGKVWDESGDSDTDSDISFGIVSASSVSSVHTSDLSSYDDEISLSDEDGTKKKISIAELNARNNSKVSSKTSGELNGTTLKTFLNSPKKITAESKESHMSSNSENEDCAPFQEIPDKLPESAPSQSPTSSISSKRRRKPNSKYISESIVCHSVKVRERKKQNVDSTMNVDKDNASQLSPKKKRTRNENFDIKVDTPSKVQKTDEKNSVKKPITTDISTSPAKQSESSDSQKPQTSVRSLTSRKTAPVTLYSTAA